MSTGVGWSLGDFTGLNVGQPPAQPTPPAAPTAGLLGFVDFTGVPVGQPPAQAVQHTPRIGCFGFIDFCGYPVGGGVRRRGHGPKVGPDRDLAAAMIQDLMARRRTQRQYVAEAQVTLAAAKVRVESVLNEANQRQAAHDRCMALILAEV